MMKLKQSLTNSAKHGLIVFSISALFLIYGCDTNFEPTYKEDDIPEIVKKICKDEYSLDVKTQRTNNTLWIYAPLDKLLHTEFTKNPEKIFDEQMSEKLRNIFSTLGRIVVSSDKSPEFFCLVASDIKIGLDYTIIGSTLDIKKSYAGIIPWPEANRRYVINFELSPEAISDTEGSHIKAKDIDFGEFLAKQISQRFDAKFHENPNSRYYKMRRSKGKFIKNIIVIQHDIEMILPPPQKININNLALETAVYCVKTYEFTDFDSLQITNLKTKTTDIFSAADILERDIP